MTSPPPFRLEFTPRAAPLSPCAVAAVGDPARELGRRLAALADAALAELTAIAGDELLVVLGEAAALPWVDGAIYLGRDEEAPALLLPCALAPTVPPAALAAAIRARVAPPPIAVVPAPRRLIPCGDARRIERARLAAWQGAR